MLACCSKGPPRNYEFLIVGGGNAAGYACQEFVAQGVAGGQLGVITAEPVVPYERPALTKAYLHPPSAKVRARLPGFHTCVGAGGERQLPEWYTDKGIDFIKGKAISADLKSKTVSVDNGEVCGYGKLILATGCSSRRSGFQGDDLQNVHYLRDERDAAGLVKALEAVHGGTGEVVILGGGYIGLEAAAAVSGWGLKTTIVIPDGHVLPRLFDAHLAKWLEDQYHYRGIALVKGERVSEFLGKDGKLEGVKLNSGKALPCCIVVAGVGAIPNVDFCQGLTMEKGGFAVDSHMRTSDPDVFAIGDVCAFPSRDGGHLTRCEHVDHARKSAVQAVKAAMGMAAEPYNYVPYFYSRLFEYTEKPVVFNFFGHQSGICQVHGRGTDSVGAIWMQDGKAVGALLMGSPGPSPDDAKKLAQIGTERPVAESAASAFAAFGL